MTQTLFYSQNESDILGFKVGRCNEDFFNPELLSQEIVEGHYDLCRLKVAAEDEMAVMKLHQMGFPFFFSGSIRRYKTRINENPPGDFLHPTMTYEMYDGTQDDLLKEMLIGTWGTYPLGYYRSPYLCELVDKELEIESVFQFYKKSNLNSLNPNNSILFMNDGGKYVGFFALNIINGNLESHIGGILEPYRKDGYFLDMLRFIKRYCVANDLPYFIFGARNENAYVQKIFQEVGFKAIGSENVFHITPLLSHSQQAVETLRWSGKFHQLNDFVIRYVQEKQPHYVLRNLKNISFDKSSSMLDLTLRISLPVNAQQVKVLVFQLLSADSTTMAHVSFAELIPLMGKI
jgi:hypothetical protein